MALRGKEAGSFLWAVGVSGLRPPLYCGICPGPENLAVEYDGHDRHNGHDEHLKNA